MNIQDLVVGRLYKVTSKKSLLGPEKEESLYMFLRARGKKALMLSLDGEYKKFDLNVIETPRADYLEIFTPEVKEIVFPLMRKFVLEYQKYDNINYSKTDGFKSKGARLKNLNLLQRDIEKLKVTPFIGKAVNSYFNFYKGLDISFNSVESTMVNFLFIQEWKNSYKKLRGFSFNSKRFADVKLDKYSQDTLILQHLYTNLCLKPNLKNIKAEWIDLLITKIYYNGYQDRNKNEVIKFLSQIKESCVSSSDNIDIFSNPEPTPIQVQEPAFFGVQPTMATGVKVNAQQGANLYKAMQNPNTAMNMNPKQTIQNPYSNVGTQAVKGPGLNTVSFADLIKENQYKLK